MVYLINYLLIPLYYFLILHIVQNAKKAHRYFFILIGIHAVLFRALANPYIYKDTSGYAEAFSLIADMSFDEAVLSFNMFSDWGQGYVALNWLISVFSSDPVYLFIIMAILSVGGVMLFYYKTTETPLLSTMFYLIYPMMYVMGFYVLRQHLAIVFVLWSVYYMDKLKYAIPLVLLGILCHSSAIVILPFFFIKSWNLRNFDSFRLFALSLIGYIVLGLLATYFISFFSRYENVIDDSEGLNNIIPVVVIGLTILVFYLTKTIHNVKAEREAFIVKFLIYGFIVALFSLTVSRAGRLTLYFIYLIPIAFSILYKYGSKTMKLLNTFYYIAIFAIPIIMIYMSSSTTYRVYEFFWNN